MTYIVMYFKNFGFSLNFSENFEKICYLGSVRYVILEYIE